MLPDERTTHNNALTLPTQVEALVAAPGRGLARPVLAFLRQQGINVRTSDDANSAFEEALMHPPDVILIDDRIAPAGGIELCERLKGNVRTHFVPTIVVALSDLRQFRMRALGAGADAVFSPATDPQERRTRLWALLRTRALYRQIERKQRNQGTEIVERRRWLAYLLHDLQGSVAALRANVDYMGRFAPAPSDPRRADFNDAVEDARTVFDQLMHSVRTVLDFDRFETGRLTIETAPIRVGDLAAEIVKELGQNPALMGEIALELPDNERVVPADPELIRRVLVNLVMHCVRRGQGRTTIRVVNAEGGVSVRIASPGATPSTTERREMFEPYSQLHEKPVGYGLGLALARAVVELHAGKIWVEDVPGGGIAFAFQLSGAANGGRGGERGRRAFTDGGSWARVTGRRSGPAAMSDGGGSCVARLRGSPWLSSASLACGVDPRPPRRRRRSRRFAER
jgi:signal transduction histidine kinase